MGVWRWLRGQSAPRQVRRLPGSGDFDFDVVGESHYQDALSAICGGSTDESQNVHCVARLQLEPLNPYDPNAVGVYIEGQKVAHLTREDAEAFGRIAKNEGLTAMLFECDAVIVGGWERGARGRGSFGVKLDIETPLVLSP